MPLEKKEEVTIKLAHAPLEAVIPIVLHASMIPLPLLYKEGIVLSYTRTKITMGVATIAISAPTSESVVVAVAMVSITMGAILVTLRAITPVIILGTRLGIATLTGTMYGMDLLTLATAGMAGGDTALGAGVGAQLGTTIATPTMLGTMVIARDL